MRGTWWPQPETWGLSWLHSRLLLVGLTSAVGVLLTELLSLPRVLAVLQAVALAVPVPVLLSVVLALAWLLGVGLGVGRSLGE